MKNIDKSQWRRSLTILSIFLILSGINGVSAQQLSGPTNVQTGIAYTYQIQYNPVINPSWTATGGTISGTPTSSASITWNQTGSRFVRVSFSNGSTSYNLELAVTVTNPPPAAPSNPTISLNGCGQATLQRVGTPPSGVTWYWQGKTSSEFFITKGSGSTFNANEGSGTYYIKARKSTGEWSINSGSVSVTIAQLTGGTINTAAPTICYGGTPSSLTSSAPAGGTGGSYSYQWQYASFGSGTWVDIPGAQAEGYSPQGTLTASRSYRRKVTCSTQTQYSNTVDVTVHPQVLTPNVTSGQRCGNGTVQLSAVPGSNANQIRWYNVSTGGTKITTGVSGNTLSFTTPALSVTTTYYAESYDSNSGCFSSTRIPVQASINPVPGLATASNPDPKCGPSAFTFTATPGTNSNSIKWYTAQSGGTLKYTGANYSTPTALPVGNTTYYAASYNTTTLCEDSQRVAVTAIVYASPPPTPIIEQITLPNCSEPNGSFIISNYNGSLYTYDISPSTGVSLQGALVSAPSAVYSIKAISISGSCESNIETVNLNGFDGPSAPPEPILINSVDPACVNAKGSFEIQNYSSGNIYTISPSVGVLGPDANGIVVAPANTYSVTSRLANTSCISSADTITINGVTIPCGSAQCSIEETTVDTLYFGPNAQNIPWTVVGNTECDLQITQKPNWIVQANVQLDNRNVNFISEANTLGDMEDIILVQQLGGQSKTITVFRGHGPNYPGNPDAPIIDLNDCSQKTLNASPNRPSDEAWFWQGKNDQSMSESLPATEPYTVDEADGDGFYYIRAKKNGNWSTKATGVYVTIKAIPEVPTLVIMQPSCLTELGTITVTNLIPGNQVSFNNGGTFENPGLFSKSGFDAGNHTVIVRNSDGCESQGTIAVVNQAPLNDCGGVSYLGHNYIYTRTYQKSASEMISEESLDQNNFDFFTESGGVVQQITYFDGLGRPLQQIGIDQSPSSNDIVTHIGYDDYGRMEKEWLPITAPDSDLATYRTIDLEAATRDYYKNHLDYSGDFPNLTGTDVNPYSQKLFEPSPLNRVLKQAAPGEAWKLNATGEDHSIEFEYLANTHDPMNVSDASKDNVRLFEVNFADPQNTEAPGLQLNGYYAQGQLYKTVTKDENHVAADGKLHTTEEFTDKQGRVVLKRTYANVGSPSEVEAHDTYYVYDDYGNLTYVLPPKVTTVDVSQIELDELCYQYVYDRRNRLVEKKIPGKGWEYIVYNKLDQPIMTQDANQAAKSPKEWLFTKYDAFGRVAYTGKATSATTVTREDIQGEVDGLSVDLWVVPSGTSTNFGSTDVYYGNGAYPTGSTTQAVLSEVLTINYYDDYDFLASETGMDLPSSVFGKNLENYNNANKIRTKGLPTGSKVKVLETSNWITSVTGYDDKGRAVYGKSKNDYLATLDVSETQLDFIGKPLKTKTVHTRNGNTMATIDNFTYDHVGRLLAQTQCIGDETLGDTCAGSGSSAPADLPLSGTIVNSQVATNSITVTNATLSPGAHLYIDGTGGAQELIVYNEYDELGQLKHKKVGGAPGIDYQGTVGLQTVDYFYNVRGWLKTINADQNTDNDLFDFTLRYNDPTSGTPLFNGNISQTLWDTQSVNPIPPDNDVSNMYTYGYDALNRIISATDNTGHYHLNNVGYDKNGNIQELERLGHTVQNPNQNVTGNFGIMDDLVYAYTGNQLTSVTDTGAGTGFLDGNPGGTDYFYDTNGNMISDGNKKITDIDYNYLNLPTKITINGNGHNGTIDYIYGATGIKLKKIATEGTAITTEYAGNYIYENGVLKEFAHPEGYVEPDGQGGYDYVYNYVDHLGNIRLAYSDLDGNGTIDSNTEILQERNYYPFGLEHKGYNNVIVGTENNYRTFQGQEIDKELGLNWLSFKYRNYDPAIGRFVQIDPLSESFSHQSHYNFAENEVIRGYELEGLEKVNSNDGARATEGTRGRYEADVNTRTIGFGLRHPVIATKIGEANKSSNISSSASRFASRGATNESPNSVLNYGAGNEGGEVNAFRHTLWQAKVSGDYGESIAKQVGAAHENNPEADTSQRTFDTRASADETTDLLNNEIGRGIGAENSGDTMLQLADKVLDTFKKDGLYTVTEGKDGKFNISRTNITDKQYNALKKRFAELNNTGRTAEEQQKEDKGRERRDPGRFGEF